jgi:transmembrane sensor
MNPRAAATPAAMCHEPRSDDDVRREAVAWYVRMCAGDAGLADHIAWQQWHDARPEHRRAWQRLESIRASTQRVPPGLARPTLEAAGRQRRQVLRSALLLASAGAFSFGAYRLTSDTAPWGAWLADVRTGTGEQRSLALSDGSALSLNTRSAVSVAFDAGRRRLRLHAGEILVETAAHRHTGGAQGDARPFVVGTVHGDVTALGTRFMVRTDARRTRVTVLEAAVAVRTAQGEGAAVVRAGQQAAFDHARIDAPRAADPAAGEWMHGSLVVDGWRLDEVVAELARYHAGRLACAPAVGGILVSGAFPVHDIDKALSAITRVFPVRVASVTRYWQTVVPA